MQWRKPKRQKKGVGKLKFIEMLKKEKDGSYTMNGKKFVPKRFRGTFRNIIPAYAFQFMGKVPVRNLNNQKPIL